MLMQKVYIDVMCRILPCLCWVAMCALGGCFQGPQHFFCGATVGETCLTTVAVPIPLTDLNPPFTFPEMLHPDICLSTCTVVYVLYQLIITPKTFVS